MAVYLSGCLAGGLIMGVFVYTSQDTMYYSIDYPQAFYPPLQHGSCAELLLCSACFFAGGLVSDEHCGCCRFALKAQCMFGSAM